MSSSTSTWTWAGTKLLENLNWHEIIKIITYNLASASKMIPKRLILVTRNIFLKNDKVTQQTFADLEDDLKRSSRHVLKMSSTRLHRKTSCKTFWRRLGRRKIVTLTTSSWCVEDMSWRRLEDVISHLTNLNVYLRNLYCTNLYLTNLSRIQNGLFRTQ